VRTKVRHIDLHPDEFLAAVAGEMSPAELGVYWMVCLLCYARGGDIAADVDWIKAKFRPGKGNRIVGDILESLIANGKVVREGSEIGVRRVRDELEIALKRIRDAHENGRKGGRQSARDVPEIGPRYARDVPEMCPRGARDTHEIRTRRGPKSNDTNGVGKPTPFSSEKLRALNHQPPGKEVGFSHQELNPSFLTPREASPPLPSQGDGGAASRPPDLGPPTKAEGLAAFKRCIDAVNGKLGVLDSAATVPPPPDPRLVEFRARLSRLNTLAGSKLSGEVRMQAWQVIAKADSLADPRALPPAMLADLDAIERLGHAEAAE